VGHYDYNSQAMIDAIDQDCACVIIEAVQSEAGIICPDLNWLKNLSAKCTEYGCLLILDEIQTGFGRTGSLWAFEQLGITPDILLLGKALGGGMPMGAMIASNDLMHQLSYQPVLGHMTTFGGHPVCCAAGLAALEVLEEEQMITSVATKEQRFHEQLKHPAIKAIRSKGLLMAIELENNTAVLKTLKECLKIGVFSDWFLFADNCIRIAPPLSISLPEIDDACALLCTSLDCLL
jgi:acetylornithine/succinyldiaminopimelate/putrescine aminotransferase